MLGSMTLSQTLTVTPTPQRPKPEPCTGVAAAGTAGIWMQTAALWAGVAPSLALAAGWRVPASVTTYGLVGGLVVSRVGLWTFDLAVSQLLQERVPDGELGAEQCVLCCCMSLADSSPSVFRHPAIMLLEVVDTGQTVWVLWTLSQSALSVGDTSRCTPHLPHAPTADILIMCGFAPTPLYDACGYRSRERRTRQPAERVPDFQLRHRDRGSQGGGFRLAHGRILLRGRHRSDGVH